MSVAAFSIFGTAGATALIAGQSPAPAAAGLSTVATSSAVTTSSAAVSTSATTPVSSSATATPTPTANCPSAVRITLGSITVSGSTVTIAFTHTGLECPGAAASTLHVHENLLRTPHAGSDPVQLNRDFAITPGFGNSVTVPLLAAVDGKCFVQVDAHANGVARGQFFPTETCPSTSVTPSQSISASSSTKPPSSTPPAGTTPAAASHSVLPESSTSPSTAALATTGTSLQDPLWIAGLLVLLGIGLLVLVRPPSRRH